MYSKISVLITVLFAAAILASTLQAATAQQQPQPQTSQGLPIVIIPAIIGNILAVVSFLIGTSFILGLRIQSAARTATTTGSTSSATLASSVMHKY